MQDSVSTDGSTAWLRLQPDLDVVSESDGGMYDAINKGWQRSSGEILSWLNADEQYLPGTLASVAEAFRRHPNVDIFFGDALIVDPVGALIAARREIPLRAFSVSGTFLYALSCATFFRRRLFDDGDLIFDPRRRFAGDAELLLALLRQGKKAQHLPRYLALFTIDGNNLTLNPLAKKEFDEIRGRGAGRLAAIMTSAARRLEKAGRGCYRRLPVMYDWAEDEQPTYRRYSYRRGATRYSWDKPTAMPLDEEQKSLADPRFAAEEPPQPRSH